MAELTLAVLISGRGSNLQSLIDACAKADFPARITLVISNEPGAKGLERAAAAGIPHQTINHRDFDSRDAFGDALGNAIKDSGAGLVCLAGFMRILDSGFVNQWHDRMINIHPSLLPAFPGLHTHLRALEAGVRFAGCTVHYVRDGLDSGPIIAQAAVPVHPGDTPDSLAERVLAAEHRVYPLSVRLIAEGRVTVNNETTLIDASAVPVTVLLNPQEG
jgi:phosphoribosylglycinamide formyltransferase-1